ncbi:MAG: hypothetical protein SGJ18_09605 [Pseudomonadota bacterium]|nr:hypothetical protein [Pseudomonadota bacterium]
MQPIIRKVLRYLFIVLFLTTAIGKLLDNRGFAEVLGTYQLLPPWSLLWLGLLISLSELGVAILLIRGVRLQFMARTIILVHTTLLGAT